MQSVTPSASRVLFWTKQKDILSLRYKSLLLTSFSLVPIYSNAAQQMKFCRREGAGMASLTSSKNRGTFLAQAPSHTFSTASMKWHELYENDTCHLFFSTSQNAVILHINLNRGRTMRHKHSVLLFPVSPGCGGHRARSGTCLSLQPYCKRRRRSTNPAFNHPSPLL